MQDSLLYLLTGTTLGLAVAAGAARAILGSRISAVRAEQEGIQKEAAARLQAKEADAADLRKRLEEAEGRLRSDQAGLQSAIADRSAAEAAREAAVEQLASLREKLGELDELRASVATVSTQRDEAERTRDRALADKDAENARLLQSQAESSEAKLAALRQQLEDAKSAQLVSEAGIRLAHETELKALRDQILAKQAEFDRLEAALKEGHAKELATRDAAIAELKSYVEKADATLKEAFGTASDKALQKATEQLLDLAKKQFGERDEQALQAFGKRKEELEKLLEPMQKELADLEELNRSIEKERAESFGTLKQTIESLNRSNESLANALKKPSVRGSWGESQLRTILESSGMIEGTNFVMQDTTSDDGELRRADVIVNLPRGRQLIIDSKVPLDKYMAATEATDEAKEQLLRDHAKAVRGHMKDLAKKDYPSRYKGSAGYVILFLPYESAYQIACEYDKDLLTDANKTRIIIANPMTLMNLVHLASYLMNEERLQESAEEVRTLGQQLCQRLAKVVELVVRHGNHVRMAANSYNDIVASVDSRLLVTAEKMRKLNSGADKSIEAPTPVDTAIKRLVAPEIEPTPAIEISPAPQSALELSAEA